MKVALIHDFLLQYGGAERVLEVFQEMFPDSVTFTLCYEPEKFPEGWRPKKIRSLMPILPGIRLYPQLYAPLLVSTIQSLELKDYDLIISSDTIFAKMIRCPERAKHICYQYSPADMLYHFLPSSHKRKSWEILLTGFQKSFLRRQDYFSAQLPHDFITLSQHVGKRVNKYYRRDYSVLYPPVSIPDKLPENNRGEYLLLVGRLVPGKYIDLLVSYCTHYSVKLVVVGSGEDLERLRALAGDTVRFVTDAGDTVRDELYNGCKALVLCNEEDFGITPVEAMAYGKGVIAFGKGGVLETVIEGRTGVFFYEQTIESLHNAVSSFDKLMFDPFACRSQAEKFSKDSFMKAIKTRIDEITQ